MGCFQNATSVLIYAIIYHSTGEDDDEDGLDDDLEDEENEVDENEDEDDDNEDEDDDEDDDDEEDDADDETGLEYLQRDNLQVNDLFIACGRHTHKYSLTIC